MLHFDMHCAARKEIHEGIAVTNKRSRTSVNNGGEKSKHRAQDSDDRQAAHMVKI
jgi:hypothetical protein